MTGGRSPVLSAFNEDERREYWAALALRCTAGLGKRWICLLLKHFGSAYAAVSSLPLWPEAGVPLKKAESLARNAWRERAKPEWDHARALGASIILWTDTRYPALLKELPDAPAFFYAIGDLSLLLGPCVAIVGSRASSAAALNMASAVAEELSQAGVTVVSGLAFGVDAYAHKAALLGLGRTIAVMPGGVDMIFPPRHRQLYRRIEERGLIISEMPPGTSPVPGSFPVRNRIISGLSLGVFMAEAVCAGSGSTITAHLAAEQGRNVYVPAPEAFPGQYREGTKKLLLEGARPIFRAADILADLFPHLKSSLDVPQAKPLSLEKSPKPKAAKKAYSAAHGADFCQKALHAHGKGTPIAHTKNALALELTQEEQTLLALLRGGPLLQDELLYAAQQINGAWTSAAVSAALMILEVKKMARRLSDGRYEAIT